MKKILFVVLLATLLYPAASFAAAIKSSTESSADSGGNSVGAGGSVRTGSESASVYSTTVVGGSSSGNVHIEIETKTDGVVHTETIERQIPAGGATIRVATSSASEGSRASAGVTVVVGTTSSWVGTTSPIVATSTPVHIWSALFDWLPKLWSIFRFF